jgi:hypothetical protein
MVRFNREGDLMERCPHSDSSRFLVAPSKQRGATNQHGARQEHQKSADAEDPHLLE